MKMRWKGKYSQKLSILLMSTAIIGLTYSCKQQAATQEKVKLETEEDKVFYTVGVMFGGKLKELKLSQRELDGIVAGLSDTALGKEPKVALAKYQPKVRKMFEERGKRTVEENKKKGQEFLQQFVKKEGAKVTKSGLAYKIIEAGKAKPKATDTVKVHYKGTLIDGTEFDSSHKRGEPAKFPLNRVIKGWTEGLQLIGVGGKVKLVIPAALGYGDFGAGSRIPGGSTLVFDVELLSIEEGQKAPSKKKK